MAQANLSEILFKPKFKHPETSTLVRHSHYRHTLQVHSALDGDTTCHWYQMLNRLIWTWRGVDPLEIEEVLSRIASSNAEHSNEKLLDTVIGYRKGNWIYEWIAQGMIWQQKALEEIDALNAGQYWLNTANMYSIASYPHLKGDELAEQAEIFCNRAYEEVAKSLPYEVKTLNFPHQEGGNLTGFLHMPTQNSGPFPTVLICGGLDTLQSDYHRLFRDLSLPM